MISVSLLDDPERVVDAAAELLDVVASLGYIARRNARS
jgi:hypothetical protein